MPFKSEAQRKFLFARKPEIAKRFAKETPKGTQLPKKLNERSKQLDAIKNKLKN